MPRSSKIRRVAVLGSGTVRKKTPLYQQAARLGRVLAKAGFSICHGGYGGTMEAVAKGCREGGGHNIGVIIRTTLQRPGVCRSRHPVFARVNPYTDAEIAMPSWQARLLKLIELGDAYVFLDGATGTLNELFFVWEMANKKLHAKPIIILGSQLHSLVKFLKKDPALKIPENFFITSSISHAIQILKK